MDCDVTDPVAVQQAILNAVLTFGGVDILISNAGAAFQSPMADCTPELLQQSFSLNFFSHQCVFAVLGGLLHNFWIFLYLLDLFLSPFFSLMKDIFLQQFSV